MKYMQAIALSLILAASGNAFAESEARNYTPAESCVHDGAAAAAGVVALAVVDCVFFGCFFTATTAATIGTGVGTATLLGTGAAAVSGCAEGAVRTSFENDV